MKLEVITKKPQDRAWPTPLLFVHGVFSCARIWEPFFLPFFAEHGYDSYAISLRGHGRSEGQNQLSTTRLRDYITDLEQVIAQIGEPPVLIGASMGGVLVQHYMQRHSILGAVLLASGPPHGMIPSGLRMLTTNPLLIRDMALMSTLGPGVATVDGARRALFRPDTPAEHIRRYLPQAQPESVLAMLDVSVLHLPPSQPRRDVPVLVLGAEQDAFISPDAVQQTAKAFGVKAELFPRMAHAMMLDEDWQKVATRILDWLVELPANRAMSADADVPDVVLR